MSDNETVAGEKPTLLALLEKAKSLEEFDTVEAGLADMEARYSKVLYPVETKEGLADAKAARAAIREVRYGVKATLDRVKKPLNDLKKLFEGQAGRITERVSRLEDPIDAQIKAEEDRQEKIKEAKRKAAEELAAKRQMAIDELAALATDAENGTVEQIEEALATAEARNIELDEFGDLAGKAMQAKMTAIIRLQSMLQAAKDKLAMQAELDALRAKQAEQDAKDKAERDAREKAEAEERAQRALEEAAAKAKAVAEAEAARKADDERRAAAEAELAMQRAELAAMQAQIDAQRAELLAQLEAAKPKPVEEKAPVLADVSALAAGFDVPQAAAEVAETLVLSNKMVTVNIAEAELPEIDDEITRSEVVTMVADGAGLTEVEAETLLVKLFGGPQ